MRTRRGRGRVQVDERNWRKLEAKLAALGNAAVTLDSDLSYKSVAVPAAMQAFWKARVTSLDVSVHMRDILAEAKARVPVRTGALRDSLTVEVDGA